MSKPISSTSLAGVGERMILVPGLMKLSGVPIANLVRHIALHIAVRKDGVAVLVRSGAAAQKWQDIAQYPKATDAVAQSVGEMQQGKSFGPLVMANRYDGIDLAGNSCRLLVMDGLPQGTNSQIHHSPLEQTAFVEKEKPSVSRFFSKLLEDSRAR